MTTEDEQRHRGLAPVASGPSWWAAALLAVALCLAVWIRVQLCFDDFANPDIGGIAYNADLIMEGGSPWIESQEFKAQGAAWIWAGAWMILGRSVETIQVLYGLWIVLGAVASGLAAHLLWSRERKTAGFFASNATYIAFAAHLFTAAQFDFNYSAWMATPYAWSFALAIAASRSDAAALLAGAAAMLAFIFKQHALVVAPVIVFALLWLPADIGNAGQQGRSTLDAASLPPSAAAPINAAPASWLARAQSPASLARRLLLICAGSALALTPLLIWYAHAGDTLRPIFALVPMDALWEYAGGGGSSAEPSPDVDVAGAPTLSTSALLVSIMVQQLKTFPLLYAAALGGALFYFVPAAPLAALTGTQQDPQRRARAIAFVFFAASLLACSLGGNRFYLHYLVQEVPALAVLAADPRLTGTFEDLAYRPPRSVRGRGRIRLLLLAVTGLLAAGVALHVRDLARGEMHRYDAFPRRLSGGATPAQSVGGYIREHSEPSETIQVWGWSAWTVYYWAQRRAPTPVYKPMGVLTEFNRDSAFESGQDLRLRHGPALEIFVARFRAAPPRFFVYSPSFVTTFGAKHDPLEDFDALLSELKTHYQRVGQFGDLVLFEDQRPRGETPSSPTQ